MSIGTSFSFCAKSEFSIRQRTSGEDGKGYDSVKLLELPSENAEISIGRSDDEEHFYISLSNYHMENTETKEFYHSRIDSRLSKRDLLNIKSYIEMLINVDFDDTTDVEDGE